MTLQRLRREPQFIDEVFAAKASRTKMEEEPVENVPDTAPQASFIISRGETVTADEDKHVTVFREQVYARDGSDLTPGYNSKDTGADGKDEFDLSDITHNPAEKSREEIIAAAEAAAFSDN